MTACLHLNVVAIQCLQKCHFFYHFCKKLSILYVTITVTYTNSTLEYITDITTTYGPGQTGFDWSNSLINVVAIETHASLQSQTVSCTETCHLHTAIW